MANSKLPEDENHLAAEPAIFTAPKFVGVSGSSAQEGSCRIVFTAGDGRRFGIEIDLAIVDNVIDILDAAR